MTEIIYKIRGDFGECRTFVEGDARSVKVAIIGADEGILVIGGRKRRLSGGVCYLSLEGIPDGDYTPKIIVGGEFITLERIRKTGDRISRPPLDLELISRLITLADRLEAKVDRLEEKVNSLTGKIEGQDLFTT